MLAAKQKKKKEDTKIKQFTRLELRRKAFLKPQGKGNRWNGRLWETKTSS